MNEKKRLQLYRKFSPLSDKDLAIIELSHGEHLTKEARQAINDIISKRDPVAYAQELKTLANQAESLIRQHEIKLKKLKKRQEARLNRMLAFLIGFFILACLVFSVTGHYATAMANGVIALVIFLYLKFL